MVAAAGGDAAALGRTTGVAWLAIVAAGVMAASLIAARYSVLNRVPLSKPAAVLADSAEQIRASLGYTEAPRDTASGFYYEPAYFAWAESQHGSKAWAEDLPSGRPAVVRYWYRTSPVPLVPDNGLSSVSPTDPQFRLHGMTKLSVDTNGRLLRFEAVPPQMEAAIAPSSAPVDWKAAFAAASLDMSAFADMTPAETPSTYADERRAWKGTLPGTTIPITIEAAGYRGRPVLFDIVEPWAKPSREPAGRQDTSDSNWMFIWLVLAAAAYAAWRNLRDGRADRRGALRLAAFMTIVSAAVWLFAPHVGDGAAEQQRFFARFGIGLFVGGAMYIVYLGFEPFVRKLWPSMLVGWSRVLNGRIRDPLIGHDALVGVACGATFAILGLVMQTLFPLRFGLAQAAPQFPDFAGLAGVGGLVLTLIASINNGMQNCLLTVFEFSFFRAVFEWVTRTRFGPSGWTVASKLRMNARASDKVFVAVAVLVTLVAHVGYTGPVVQRWLPAIYEGLGTLSRSLG